METEASKLAGRITVYSIKVLERWAAGQLITAVYLGLPALSGFKEATEG